MLDLKNLDLVPVKEKEKQKLIHKYIKKHNCQNYIETGAYHGETVRSIITARSLKTIPAKNIYAIELGDALFKALHRQYERYESVYLYHGDTTKELPKVLDKIKTKSLFWLDAHYSGGETARGKIDCPVLNELRALANHQIKNHIILIDDARSFNDKDTNDWPTIKKIINALQKINKNYNINVVNDIIIAEI